MQNKPKVKIGNHEEVLRLTTAFLEVLLYQSVLLTYAEHLIVFLYRTISHINVCIAYTAEGEIRTWKK